MVDGNPQIEHGYTRIANELMEAIYHANFTASQLRVLLYLLRNTYGYSGRKFYLTSYARLAEILGCGRRNAIKVIQSLTSDQVVNCEGTTKGVKLSINKRYREWQVVNSRGTSEPQGHQGVNSQFTTTSEPPVHPIKETKKETIRKTPLPPLPEFLDPELWQQFLKHRKEIRHSLNPTAQQSMLTKFTKWHERGIDVNAQIEESLSNGWRGVFEPKGQTNGTHQRAHESPAERQKRITAELFGD